MQTFLPEPNIISTAKCLDYKRLGKQRVEALQIYKILTENKESRWRNHPAVLMWRGYENALALYYNIILSEWIDRGYKNKMEPLFFDSIKAPWWFGYKPFHDSHKSNLLRKDFEFYCAYHWNVPDDLPYYWPVKKLKRIGKETYVLLPDTGGKKEKFKSCL